MAQGQPATAAFVAVGSTVLIFVFVRNGSGSMALLCQLLSPGAACQDATCRGCRHSKSIRWPRIPDLLACAGDACLVLAKLAQLVCIPTFHVISCPLPTTEICCCFLLRLMSSGPVQGLALAGLLLRFLSNWSTAMPWPQQAAEAQNIFSGSHKPALKQLRSHRLRSAAAVQPSRCRAQRRTIAVASSARLTATRDVNDATSRPCSAQAKRTHVARTASCPLPSVDQSVPRPLLARMASSPAICLRSHALELATSDAGSCADLQSLGPEVLAEAGSTEAGSASEYCSGCESSGSSKAASFQDAHGLQASMAVTLSDPATLSAYQLSNSCCLPVRGLLWWEMLHVLLCSSAAAVLLWVQDGTPLGVLGSLGLDGACSGAVQRACPEAHLLQFARSILGEPVPTEVPATLHAPPCKSWTCGSCTLSHAEFSASCSDGLDVLKGVWHCKPPSHAWLQDCAAAAWGAPNSLFGEPDCPAAASAPWELIVQERSADLAYWAWRRPLRGLYLYMTQALIEGASPAAVRAFHMDDAARSVLVPLTY